LDELEKLDELDELGEKYFRQPYLEWRPGSLPGDSVPKAAIADLEGDNLR
jgi:hypothetical protein